MVWFRRLSGSHDIPARLIQKDCVNVDAFSVLLVRSEEYLPDQGVFLSMAEADLKLASATFKRVITIGASLLGFIENSCLDKPGTLAQRTAVAESLNQLFITEIRKELKKR